MSMEQVGKSFKEARITIYCFIVNISRQLSSEFCNVKLFIIPIKLGFGATFDKCAL